MYIQCISILNCVFSLQLPTGAVPMFGGGANPLAAAIKKQRKQESDEVNKTRLVVYKDVRVKMISAFHVVYK